MKRPVALVVAAIVVVASVRSAGSDGSVTSGSAPRGNGGRADAQVARGGVISGRLTDSYGRAAVYELVSIRERRQKSPITVDANVLGMYRASGLAAGDYFVSAQLHAEPIRLGSTEGPLLKPAIVFYPDELDPLRATPITVVDGQERRDIDLVLRRVAALR